MQRLVGYLYNFFPALFSLQFHKMIYQCGKIVKPVTQGRGDKPYDLEPIIEVFPEKVLSYKFFETFICGRNQPHIDTARLRLADPFYFSILQNIQKLDLYRR